MSSLSDPTDAVSPEHTSPASDLPTSGDDLNEVLSQGARVAFRGSVFIDGQHYPHGEKLAELCEELDLEYKQSVTKSTCDLLVSDDLEARDTKAELARKYDKPVIPSEDFADWAQERLAGEPVADAAEPAGGLPEGKKQPEPELQVQPPVETARPAPAPAPTPLPQHGDVGQAVPSRLNPLIVLGVVSVLLTVVMLARRRK